MELVPGVHRIEAEVGGRPGHLGLFDERSGALFSGDCLQRSVYPGGRVIYQVSA